MLGEHVDSWVEQWKRQGLEQGLKQGLQRGERKILLRQIQKRFGHQAKWVEEKIAKATEKQIEHWADNILDAATLEDVFQE